MQKHLEIELIDIKSNMKKTESDFNDIWKLYPKKAGKVVAFKYYRMLLQKKYSHNEIKSAMLMYIDSIKDLDYKYILQGKTFFMERIYDYLDIYLNSTNKKIEKKVIVDNKTNTFKIDSRHETLLLIYQNIEYDQYLQTNHWQHFKKEALLFFNNTCVLCNSKSNIHIHHKTYKNRGRETFNDVIALCNICHQKNHDNN